MDKIYIKTRACDYCAMVNYNTPMQIGESGYPTPMISHCRLGCGVKTIPGYQEAPESLIDDLTENGDFEAVECQSDDYQVDDVRIFESCHECTAWHDENMELRPICTEDISLCPFNADATPEMDPESGLFVAGVTAQAKRTSIRYRPVYPTGFISKSVCGEFTPQILFGAIAKYRLTFRPEKAMDVLDVLLAEMRVRPAAAKFKLFNMAVNLRHRHATFGETSWGSRFITKLERLCGRSTNEKSILAKIAMFEAKAKAKDEAEQPA